MNREEKGTVLEPMREVNPWRESLENCIDGSNYLRAGEYRKLIAELDRLYALAAQQRAETPPDRYELGYEHGLRFADENLSGKDLLIHKIEGLRRIALGDWAYDEGHKNGRFLLRSDVMAVLVAATPPERAETPQASSDRIKRLKDAIEGECGGLAITDAYAKVILDYVDGAETPPEPLKGKCSECGALQHEPNAFLALYCVRCIETKIGPALASGAPTEPGWARRLKADGHGGIAEALMRDAHAAATPPERAETPQASPEPTERCDHCDGEGRVPFEGTPGAYYRDGEKYDPPGWEDCPECHGGQGKGASQP